MTVESSTKTLALAMTDAARKRVLWENARDTGEGDVFACSQAHRQAEAAAKTALEAAITQYAEEIRSGAFTLE